MNENRPEPKTGELFEIISIEEFGKRYHVTYHRTEAAAQKKLHSLQLNWPEISFRIVELDTNK